MGKQWYKHVVESVNKKLLEHQGLSKEDDFPLMGQDKKIVPKMAPTGPAKPTAPAAPKVPAASITMDWIKEQKAKLKGK